MRTRTTQIITGAALAAVFATSGPASAATLSVTQPPNGPKLLYFEAAPGESNDVTVKTTPDGYVISDAANPLAVEGCAQSAPNEGTCSAAGSSVLTLALSDGANQLNVLADLDVVASGAGATSNGFYASGNGSVSFLGSAGIDHLFGGAGDDFVYGGDGDDTVGGGAGDDELNGGDDDDILKADAGIDKLIGDDGWDTIDYSIRSQPLALSLDGVANDGRTIGGPLGLTEGDNVAESSEVLLGGVSEDVLRGGSGREELRGFGGKDRIRGGAGPDEIFAGNGRDRVAARDGETDFVKCGRGKDRARADKNDDTRACEKGRG